MESRARHLMVATKISTISRALGKKSKILGGIFGDRDISILGQESSGMHKMTGYTRYGG